MKKTGLFSLAGVGVAMVLYMGLSAPAVSAVPAYTDFFLCDQPNFVVGRFPGLEGVSETDMFFRILGKMEASVPGYTYSLTEKKTLEAGQMSNLRVLNLILRSPEKPVEKGDTSTTVVIDKTFKYGDSVTDLIIRVYRANIPGKEIKTIVCTLETE